MTPDPHTARFTWTNYELAIAGTGGSWSWRLHYTYRDDDGFPQRRLVREDTAPAYDIAMRTGALAYVEVSR